MPPSLTRINASEVGVKNGKSNEEPIEVKRARGEVSCAECRRLKLRCNKKIPCGSCIRRGCQVICPNGVLTSGQGSRFILSDTDELHQRITEMSNRIRQLEDALANAQATISREPHPMLSPELLAIKHRLSSSRKDSSLPQSAKDDDIDKTVMLSFGDLALTEPDGGEEFREQAFFLPNMYRAESVRTIDSNSSTSSLPTRIEQLSNDFPFAPLYLPKEEIRTTITSLLPSYDRALKLCEMYAQHAAWWVRPIGRDQIWEELLPGAYDQQRGRLQVRHPGGENQPPVAIDVERLDSHELAALLMVLAVGAVSGFAPEPCSEEAGLYFHLARAALCLKSVLDTPSVAAIQAICLMASYDMVSLRERSLESASKSVTFAMMLAVNIGLHRDPTHWKFEPNMIQRRRVLFWELMYVDAWKSIASGRPTGVHFNDIDCELPFDTEATLDENGEEVPSFWRWKYLFLRSVFLELVHKINSARPMKYSEILELDGKVREFGPRRTPSQGVKLSEADGNDNADKVRAYLQAYMLSLLKDITLQLLHRNFFARALLENPTNPMKTSFAPSFLSCYNSAISILQVVRGHFDGIENFVARYWSTWTYTPISAIILGSVAARSPTLELAPRAFVDLELTIKAFKRAKSIPLIQVVIPVILLLRDRAYRALVEVGHDPDKLVRELGSDDKLQLRHAGEEADLNEPSGNQHSGNSQPVLNAPTRSTGTSNPLQQSDSAYEIGNTIQRSPEESSSNELSATTRVNPGNRSHGDGDPTCFASVHRQSLVGEPIEVDDPLHGLDFGFLDRVFPSTSPLEISDTLLGNPGDSYQSSQARPPLLQLEPQQISHQAFDFFATSNDSAPAFSTSPTSVVDFSGFSEQPGDMVGSNSLAGNAFADSGVALDQGYLTAVFSNLQDSDFSAMLAMPMDGNLHSTDAISGAQKGASAFISSSGMARNETVEAEVAGSGGAAFRPPLTEVQDADAFPESESYRTTVDQGGHEPSGPADLDELLRTFGW